MTVAVTMAASPNTIRVRLDVIFAPWRSGQPPRSPEHPFPAHQAEEEHQHDRHVPELFLFYDRDALPAERNRLDEPARLVRPEEPTLGLLCDPPQERRAHGGVEVLSI